MRTPYAALLTRFSSFRSLANNKITFVESQAFAGLTGISDLCVKLLFPKRKKNNYANIGSYLFPPTSSLADNQITTLPSFPFQGMVSLRTLDLSRNNISAMSVQAFSDVSALTSMSVGGEKIERMVHIIVILIFSFVAET